MKTYSRPVYFLLGWGFFSLGAVGAFLPVLPTTPFMILALWAFSRSSQRLHQWLYRHRLFGPALQRWESGRVIPLSAKLFSTAMMLASLAYLLPYSPAPVYGKVGAVAVMAYGAWYIWTKPSRLPGQSSSG